MHKAKTDAPAAPHGAWLALVRFGWLACFAGTALLFIPSMQATLSQAEKVCPDMFSCNGLQTPVDARKALLSMGMGPHEYAIFGAVLLTISFLVFYGVGALLMIRRSSDRMVLLGAFTLVFAGGSGGLLQLPSGVWNGPAHAVNVLSLIFVALFFFLFPTGRFTPRWTAYLAGAFIVFQLAPEVAPAPPAALQDAANGVYAGFLLSIVAVQIYRYRRVSTPIQRQQTKVVIAGIAGFVASGVAVVVAVSVNERFIESNAIFYLTVQVLTTLSALLIVLAVAVAMFRYRLWDVDVVISRSLVYVLLTASLLLVYLGSVVGLQALFRAITGQQSDLAIAISTLLIAALFNPLRHRFQALIQRTFYRRRYDAARVLSAFGAACRDQTDMESIRQSLLGAIDDTLQPENAFLWVREG